MGPGLWGAGMARCQPQNQRHNMTTQLQSTPEIHADAIQSQAYFGTVDTPEGELHLVRLTLLDDTDWLAAGSACNAGLLPTYARRIDAEYESTDEAIQDFVADIEAAEADEHPSSDLLAWRGSMVI